MSAWDIDLTTRVGAREATQSAASACGLFTLLFGFCLYKLGRMFDFSTVPLSILLFAGFVLGAAFLATLCFKLDKGAWAGMLMLAALLVLVLVAVAITIALADGFSIFITIPVAAVCFVVGRFTLNGMRAARALNRVERFEDDDMTAFD
jgi:hypothetical protein